VKKYIKIIIIFLIIVILGLSIIYVNFQKNKDSGVVFCEDYLDIFKSVEESLNPEECNLIDDEICMNACFSNYAWFSLDKEYCKYNINPYNVDDVSQKESCYVNIAINNKDPSFCEEINFNLEGYGYINYIEGRKTYLGYYLENLNKEFLAEINPKTYCYYRSIDKSNYENCNNINLSDKLKDVCYFDFVVIDISNPNYTGKLPFSCNDLKTNEGKEFCEILELDVNKIRRKGIFN
jgi:hypothetical protein